MHHQWRSSTAEVVRRDSGFDSTVISGRHGFWLNDCYNPTGPQSRKPPLDSGQVTNLCVLIFFKPWLYLPLAYLRVEVPWRLP